eukprot:6173144-Pleurochrysis_carterae.AAC.1
MLGQRYVFGTSFLESSTGSSSAGTTELNHGYGDGRSQPRARWRPTAPAHPPQTTPGRRRGARSGRRIILTP